MLTDAKLSDRAVRVYGVLAMSAFQGNVARIGLRRIAEMIGCSRASAHRAIQELAERGHVTVGAIEAGERAYYVLNSMVFAKKQRAGVEDVISSPSGVPRMASVRIA